jgi:hypothetical protein
MKSLPVQNPYGFQWAVDGPGLFSICGRTVPTLPAGAYTCWLDNCGNPHFQQRDLQVDELIDFPDSLPSRILRELDTFWESGGRFAEYGFLHRRGYLLYGKQGGGKSSLVHQVIAKIVAQGHVAFFCQMPYGLIAAMQRFRQVEPERPLVCVFEDIDAIIQRFGDNELLQWLDGNHQVNRCVNLATTNYPEKLDRRIVSRPRRFDRILKIESPEDKLRDAYFARKMPELADAERAEWVRLSAGLSFASLAEMIISVCCMGHPLAETARLLQELESNTPSSAEWGTQVNPNVPVPVNGEQDLPEDAEY